MISFNFGRGIFLGSLFLIGSMAHATLGNSELVSSAPSAQISSSAAQKYASYEACKKKSYSPKFCRDATDKGLDFTKDSDDASRFEISESVQDCVKQRAREAGDKLGLEVSDRLFYMRNLNNPNSFASRAVRSYYDLCTQGG
jgi:hypothetical protein